MKLKTVFLSACLVLGCAMLAYAADISGKWTATVQGQGGQTREQTFTFKVEGSKLTGTVSGMQGDLPISDGKVAGNDVSFTVVANFNGNEVKSLYKGTVAGDEIKFTRTREGGNRPPQEFTAKRAK